MNRAKLACLILTAVVLAAARPAGAWIGEGHERASRLAVSLLGQGVPEFFVAGVDDIVHCSLDPDLFVGPKDGHMDEGPDHYIDLEVLGAMPLPARRNDLLLWCGKHDLAPSNVGFVPYAIAEWSHRLTIAFAEYRKWPKDERVQRKCLVYAGILAHYTEDLCQPLHTTIHHDGKAKADGKSPKTGIHLKVDALIGKLPPGADALVAAKEKDMKPFDDLFAAVQAELLASHGLVDRVYEIEKSIPDMDAPLAADGDVTKFAQERLGATSLFTARVFLTAWRDSGKISLPPWHDRVAKSPATQPAGLSQRGK